MKKFLFNLTLILGFMPFLAHAQWTTGSGFIYYTGNVGVGNTAPSEKLSVKADNPIFKIGDNGGNGMSFQQLSDTFGGQFRMFDGAGNYVMAIKSTNVGIGTLSPAAKLDVFGGNMNVYYPGNPTQIQIGNSTTTGKTFGIIRTSTDIGGYLDIHTVSAVGTAGGNIILNQDAGNVAIGTTDPKGYKLAVNGGVVATAVTVKLNANWPDFVFKPNYKLPSLTSVQNYINANHHLPNMPSADEVAEHGQNLGEINKVLTQKVEELTLYLIEKDKQLNAQEERLKKLESIIEQMPAAKLK